MNDDDAPLLAPWALAGSFAFAVAATVVAMLLLPPAAALATGILALMMSLITLIDMKHYIIPDLLSLPAVPIGMLANAVVFHGGDWAAGVTESSLGAVLAGGSFYLLRAVWFRLRSVEGLGLGDVKLAAAAGAWLGPALLAPACLAATLAGLAAVLVMLMLPGRRVALADHIPFGSFIAPVILLFWIWRLVAAAAP